MVNNEAFYAGLAEQQAQVSADLLTLRVKYGLDVTIKGELDSSDIELVREMNLAQGPRYPFTLEEIHAIGRILVTEISKYPPVYIQYSRVGSITVFRGLEEDECQGIAFHDRTGRPIFGTTRDGFEELANTVHHELFHQADDTFTDVVSQFDYDDEWIAIGPQLDALKPVIGGHAYSLTKSSDDAPHEDRARTAAALMVLSPWARKSILDPKMIPQMARVMGAFQARSKGLMDFSYFQDLLEGRVGETYWTSRLNNPQLNP